MLNKIAMKETIKEVKEKSIENVLLPILCLAMLLGIPSGLFCFLVYVCKLSETQAFIAFVCIVALVLMIIGVCIYVEDVYKKHYLKFEFKSNASENYKKVEEYIKDNFKNINISKQIGPIGENHIRITFDTNVNSYTLTVHLNENWYDAELNGNRIFLDFKDKFAHADDIIKTLEKKLRKEK